MANSHLERTGLDVNGSELLPSNGEIRATVFWLVSGTCRVRSMRGTWRVQRIATVSGASSDVVVGRKYRGRNTFRLCGVDQVVDVVVG